MSSVSSPGDLTIDILQARCADEQARYKKTRDASNESVHCIEIVRRAARHDEIAIGAAVDIAQRVVPTYCPSDLRALQQHEDLQQEVLLQLTRKFRNTGNPYQAGTFAQYLAFLKVMVVNTAYDMRKTTKRRNEESLEKRAAVGIEPAVPSIEDQVEHRQRFERLLALLPTTTMRTVFYHRFALNEKPAEVAEALTIPKTEVYRLIEQAIRLLSQHPEARDMFGDD